MSTPEMELNPAYSSLGPVMKQVSEELGEVYRASRVKLARPNELSYVLNELKLINVPYPILIGPEDHFIGKAADWHDEIFMKMRKKRGEKDIDFSNWKDDRYISGVVFSLKSNPEVRYIRLDIEAYEWESIPPPIQRIINEGFVVIDASHHRVDIDVDYSKIWHERNDLF